MITGLDMYYKYGFPDLRNNIEMWDVPPELEIGVIPKRIYCNKDIIAPLSAAFHNLITTGYVNELKTWDGCYNFRPIRGYEATYKSLIQNGKKEQAIKYLSIHSWGDAIDVNAFENGLGQQPKLSAGFVKCFIDTGFFDWGGNFTRKDGMHFQLSKI